MPTVEDAPRGSEATRQRDNSGYMLGLICLGVPAVIGGFVWWMLT